MSSCEPVLLRHCGGLWPQFSFLLVSLGANSVCRHIVSESHHATLLHLVSERFSPLADNLATPAAKRACVLKRLPPAERTPCGTLVSLGRVQAPEPEPETEVITAPPSPGNDWPCVEPRSVGPADPRDYLRYHRLPRDWAESQTRRGAEVNYFLFAILASHVQYPASHRLLDAELLTEGVTFAVALDCLHPRRFL